ncbi:CLUMA_CG010067, isoform A [Clunio marinus]|uniref:CLUMA_CG010067, isoform A n=1 Tax=Clunio marinus TaxID=568069 RepID=A0A1J1ID18_9DIPT|nr:CLUMA_CG010067, isoform A [Clunio marinus]
MAASSDSTSLSISSPSNENLMDNYVKSIVLMLKRVKDFNKLFSQSLEENRKLAKDLWNLIARYNIIQSIANDPYPEIQKEELLCEMIVTIQETSNSIYLSMKNIRNELNNLNQLLRDLQSNSLSIDWNATSNPDIKGNVKYRPITQYLEEIADNLCKLQLCKNNLSGVNKYYRKIVNPFEDLVEKERFRHDLVHKGTTHLYCK